MNSTSFTSTTTSPIDLARDSGVPVRSGAASIVVIAGGVGAARFLSHLCQVVDAKQIVVIVNTGDDSVFHGLNISPDIDTVTYTVAGAIDVDRGWGLAGESWVAMASLGRYEKFGANRWFNLGDQDLATHLWRTGRLREGATLSEVCAEQAAAWGLGFTMLPMTNESVATKLDTEIGPLDFQEYFVKHHHGVGVTGIRLEGIDRARPAPGVIEAIQSATSIVIAPSNPLVSIGPIIAVPGIREALRARRDVCTAISPIIAGAALKGPADEMLSAQGIESSCFGVAGHYQDFVSRMIIDSKDAGRLAEIQALGLQCIAIDTIMAEPGVGPELARAAVASKNEFAAMQMAAKGEGRT